MGQDPQALGEFEQMVLLAVLCAAQGGADAYGVTVHAALEPRTKWRVPRLGVEGRWLSESCGG